MSDMLDTLLENQRAYFAAGKTLPLSARTAALRRLYQAIKERETEICEALAADLGKGRFESYMCEIGMVLSEITHALRHIKKWAGPRRVKTPLAQFPSKSYVKPSPLGNTLIMSPWNYPFLLTVGPLVDAIAAGNTAIVKPSAYSPATSALVQSLLTDVFARGHVDVVTGGRQENAGLLQRKFDLVFFTGSTGVGREVLRHTAEHLTPAILELGGKSPCIVDETAKIELAAKRIVFGKFLNCGQTCVAPDYVLCHAAVKDRLLAAIKAEILHQYGTDPLLNPDYGKIINEKHFERVLSLIDRKKVVHGGEFSSETLQIAPTVMDGVTTDDAVMGEEIFGPVLPILTFTNITEVLDTVRAGAKPLALYMFSESKQNIHTVTTVLAFGGGCINDVIIHLATSEMGFGGVGESGMGAYHGKRGFEAFSHLKSIVKKSTKIDLPMRYRPYRRLYEGLLRKFLK